VGSDTLAPMPDDRPERERYRRASLREQLGGEVRSFLGHTPLVVLVACLLGGWLLLIVTRPEVMPVTRLTAGDCLYIHASDADPDNPNSRAIGSGNGAIAGLYAGGAERAACDGSHSHEVADAWALDDVVVADYPGEEALRTRASGRCEAAFTTLVGRPSDPSSLALVVAVPPAEAWEAGRRVVACLVANDDGSFLDRPASGSAR
jgi:hypothetical protein